MGQAKRRKENDPDFGTRRRVIPPVQPRYFYKPRLIEVGGYLGRKFIMVTGRLYEVTNHGNKRITDKKTIELVATYIDQRKKEQEERTAQAGKDQKAPIKA